MCEIICNCCVFTINSTWKAAPFVFPVLFSLPSSTHACPALCLTAFFRCLPKTLTHWIPKWTPHLPDRPTSVFPTVSMTFSWRTHEIIFNSPSCFFQPHQCVARSCDITHFNIFICIIFIPRFLYLAHRWIIARACLLSVFTLSFALV